MNPVILYRDIDTPDEEKGPIHKYFEATSIRTAIPNRLVVGRYSVLPYYKELEDDLLFVGSKLINTYKQHRYLADLRNWVEDIGDLTPKTWYWHQDLPDNGGPFVVKGETNSKKHSWDTHMFAKDKRDAGLVMSRLSGDGLIGQQSIYFREYVPLKTLLVGLNGLPVTEEFRFFICNGKVLCGAYYWSSFVNDLTSIPDVESVPQEFLNEIIRRVGTKATFWVVDVAKTDDGRWIVIELNDGQMSGLSENDPDKLYENLAAALQVPEQDI
jgi:hypothetical protein